VGGAPGHRYGDAARGLRLDHAAPPRPHQSQGIRPAHGLQPEPRRPVPAGDREARAERVVERAYDPFELVRMQMAEEQLVRRGITDARVLGAMRKVPRQLFVEEALRGRAYGDHPLPIGEEQTISQTYIVALMTQLLRSLGRKQVYMLAR